MKPRKKQRIDVEENENGAKNRSRGEGKKERKVKKVTDESEDDSSQDEGLDELIDDEDDLPGRRTWTQFLILVDDEMDIEEADDSEESGQDDFQDVKLKSTPPSARCCSLLTNPPERKKQSKDPAAFATAMSAILSSSLKAHTRAVPPLSPPFHSLLTP
jgi:hypothetical protein